MSNNGPRFQARPTNNEFPCVVDTTVPLLDTSPPPRHPRRTICVCEDIESAIIIAHALNREAMQQ